MFITWRFRKKHAIIAAACMAALCLSAGLYATQAAGVEGGDVQNGVDLPIIMYHSMLNEKSRSGAYVITPQTFEEDLQYLQAHGYTTVVIQDLIDYVYSGKELPQKPIMLTFDDGYYNNYLYAFPLLKKYNAKMVLSPVGRYTDQYSESEDNHANYSYVTWMQIKEMIDSGLVEIQNHSYDMHANNKSQRKGAQKTAGETLEQYKHALTADVMKMQERTKEMTGYTPTAFTYPLGAVSKEAQPILEELGFQATLVCESRINRITRAPECLYNLGRFLRPSGPGSAQYFTETVKLPE